MIYQIKEFCSQQFKGDNLGCEDCPLLDKVSDTCILHSDIPGNWDVKKIKEVLENGASGS